MIFENFSCLCVSTIRKYRTYSLVFLITLFISLTLAHPAILLNDEFITTNQLHQLNAGHQIVSNEGKYGLQENGSMSYYFAARSNLLGYTLFLPLLSLPAHWIINLTGEHFVYLILCIWTIIALIILLIIDRFYPQFATIGQWNWIPLAFVISFALLFINLNFYASFPANPFTDYPEILAIVFTNVILLAIASVLIYDTNYAIFENQAYAFFGTLICLFSSSYFVWATHCKDHLLVLPLFAAILLCLIRFTKTDSFCFLALGFLFTGLLAWVRPELALWIFIFLFCLSVFTTLRYRSQSRPSIDLASVLFSPVFTVIGALPFFLNNYLITKNAFLPVQSVYFTNGPLVSQIVNSSEPWVRAVGVHSTQSVILRFVPNISGSPIDFITDCFGIFFYPITGSISVFGLVPLFLAMSILAVIFLAQKKIQFSSEERTYLGLSLVLSLAVFLSYASQIHLLNADMGVIPDIRYFSPMYLPLMLCGLIIVRRMNVLPENPVESVKSLIVTGIIGLSLLLVLLLLLYTFKVNFPLGKFYSVYAFILVILTIGTIIFDRILKFGKLAIQYLILLLCLVPFFWQVTTMIVVRTQSGYAAYTFWIPITRIIWELIISKFLS
jgi:hypothetical protein